MWCMTVLQHPIRDRPELILRRVWSGETDLNLRMRSRESEKNWDGGKMKTAVISRACKMTAVLFRIWIMNLAAKGEWCTESRRGSGDTAE